METKQRIEAKGANVKVIVMVIVIGIVIVMV